MPSDWNSGQHVWLVDLCAPFGGAQEVLKDLRQGVLEGREIHQFTLGPEGLAQSVVQPTAD